MLVWQKQAITKSEQDKNDDIRKQKKKSSSTGADREGRYRKTTQNQNQIPWGDNRWQDLLEDSE